MDNFYIVRYANEFGNKIGKNEPYLPKVRLFKLRESEYALSTFNMHKDCNEDQVWDVASKRVDTATQKVVAACFLEKEKVKKLIHPSDKHEDGSAKSLLKVIDDGKPFGNEPEGHVSLDYLLDCSPDADNKSLENYIASELCKLAGDKNTKPPCKRPD